MTWSFAWGLGVEAVWPIVSGRFVEPGDSVGVAALCLVASGSAYGRLAAQVICIGMLSWQCWKSNWLAVRMVVSPHALRTGCA